MRIGIDFGGTKIEGVVLDAAGNERLRRRIATPAGDYARTLAAIAGLVAELEGTCGRADGIGVGIPGTVSRQTGQVKNANATWLNGRPLDRDLAEALARPVAVANDANCFAISEAIDGAGRGAEVVFGVILGTGVGGGIVAHGRVITGANGIGGEWGHNPLPWPLLWPLPPPLPPPLPRPDGSDESPGPACYCGRRGCIETFLSGPGMAARFREATGRTATAAEIAAAAAAGDPEADAALARYEHRLARALASVINVVDPDVIVLGGGLSNIARLYDAVPRLWGAFVFSDAVVTRLVRNRFGDASGVRGAARLGAPAQARPELD